MMDFTLFAKSLFLGLAIAAPLGPIGALCINRTLEHGLITGIVGGLGTALADGIYATCAALGFATFSSILILIDLPLRLVGGMFMLWLGWRCLHSGHSQAAITASSRNLASTMTATFLLTITNPMTILSFAALFAGLGLASTTGPAGATLVVAGVFSGSMLWWCLLSSGVALSRRRLPNTFAHRISRTSGLVIIGFGLWALLSALI